VQAEIEVAERKNPLLPRQSKRHRTLYKQRSAIERESGRLKHYYGLASIRVRALERVQLHGDLTMLGRLGSALAAARASHAPA
jgi:Transposase DDE domain